MRVFALAALFSLCLSSPAFADSPNHEQLGASCLNPTASLEQTDASKEQNVMTRDLHNNVKVSPAINPGAIITGNGTTVGATIDTRDYDSLEFAVQSGAITDGAFAVKVFHGDASDMSDEAECAAADLLGSAPSFAAADDNEIQRVGYRGSKQYARLKAVQSGATTGGYLSAQAIQGHAKVRPVA